MFRIGPYSSSLFEVLHCCSVTGIGMPLRLFDFIACTIDALVGGLTSSSRWIFYMF